MQVQQHKNHSQRQHKTHKRKTKHTGHTTMMIIAIILIGLVLLLFLTLLLHSAKFNTVLTLYFKLEFSDLQIFLYCKLPAPVNSITTINYGIYIYTYIYTGCIKKIGAVLKLIIFTSMVNRIINTTRNERVTQ